MNLTKKFVLTYHKPEHPFEDPTGGMGVLVTATVNSGRFVEAIWLMPAEWEDADEATEARV